MVTKLHDNFGFVDEDVFFQMGVVKGQAPRVNVCVILPGIYQLIRHNTHSALCRIGFLLRPASIQTCLSSGTQHEFKFCPTKVQEEVDLQLDAGAQEARSTPQPRPTTLHLATVKAAWDIMAMGWSRHNKTNRSGLGSGADPTQGVTMVTQWVDPGALIGHPDKTIRL